MEYLKISPSKNKIGEGSMLKFFAYDMNFFIKLIVAVPNFAKKFNCFSFKLNELIKIGKTKSFVNIVKI